MEHGAIGEAYCRALLFLRGRTSPLRRKLRGVRRQPLEMDLIAVEEAAQLGANGIPARRDHEQSRLVRFRRNRLQAAEPLARQRPDLLGEIR